MSLKHAILAAISSKPQAGYDLGAEMEGSICFFWNASRQQIYKELGELEKTDWVGHKEVRQDDRPDKKIYHITPDGLGELKDWIRRETDRTPIRDALLIKVFAGHLVPPEALGEELERQKQKHAERLSQFLDLEKKHLSGPHASSIQHGFQYLALRRGIHAERAWLAWAKEVQGFLKSRKKTAVSRPLRSSRPLTVV